MNKDRPASEKLIRGLEKQGFKAIMLTVDAAVPGNREIDKRSKGFTVRFRLWILWSWMFDLMHGMGSACRLGLHMGRAEPRGRASLW